MKEPKEPQSDIILYQAKVNRSLLHGSEAAIGPWIFDCTPIGMVLVSRDGHILRANRAFGTFLGYRPRDLVGKTIQDITHPDDLALTGCMIHQAGSARGLQSRGRLIRQEKRYLHKMGKVVWGEVNAGRIARMRGKDRFILAQVIDITERKQAEEVVRQSEQAYKALADNAPDLVVRFDKKLRHLYVSPAIEAITGLSPRRFIGKTNKELGVPKSLDSLWIRAMRSVFRTARTKTIEFEMETLQGWRCYQSRIAPEFASDGSVHCLVSVVRDVTEQRRLEEALQKSHADLEAKVKERTSRLRALAGKLTQAEQRERQRLAHVLHEDLQQILVSSKFFVSALRKHLTDPPLRRKADRTLELLDASIAVSRNLCIDLRPPVLYELGLAAALEWLARDMREKLGLVIDVKASKAAIFATDDMRSFAFTAVRELVMNVGKHAGVKAASIRVKPPRAGRIAIEVRDKGTGFDIRLDRGQKFGLFSIRERADALGGCLDLVSYPGAGTCATLTLPVRCRTTR